MQAIREAFELIYTMNLHLPARFVMLDKAIATLGSVGAELYPDFNVFEIAKPYARALVVERFTPGRMAGLARKEARDLARIARVMPYQIHDILEVVREGRLEVRLPQTELDEAMRHLDVAMNRLVVALVVAAGLIGSSFLAAAATARRPSALVGHWLRAVAPARCLADVGRYSPRSPVEASSHVRAKGQLDGSAPPGYGRLNVPGAPRRRARTGRSEAFCSAISRTTASTSSGPRTRRRTLELVERVRPDLVLLATELDVCRRLRTGEPGRSWDRAVPGDRDR